LSGTRRATISKFENRTSTARRRGQQRRQSRWVLRISLLAIASLASLLLWAILARTLAPLANTNRQSFDAIVVLGTPADSDGNPTPELLDRVTEAVHEYQRGVAPRILVTGAAAHNRFVEADVMARVAEAQGVPASQILEESQALDTIENACYSTRLMTTHGWHSAEVVSSAPHLPRAAIIFSHLSDSRLEWRVHPATANVTPGYYSNAANLVEILKTARYLAWSRWVETCSL
jgi:uncharacterized SAM-binding protein YcdF (DUF218 family)